MSKVVKKAGRAVKKVVKGVGKVVKKVAKSPIFKAIAIAAAVYFTGGAVLGAIGGASGGLAGMASGAAAGLGNAAAGITGAWSAITSGAGLGAAGSSLAGGITGASAAGAGAASAGGGLLTSLKAGFAGTAAGGGAAGSGVTVGTGLANPSLVVDGVAQGTAVQAGSQGLAGMTVEQLQAIVANPSTPASTIAEANQLLAAAGHGAKSGGLLRNPLVQYGAMQMGGSMLQGHAQQKGQEKADEDERKRYNRNVGTQLWESRY